jgi:hypothetical protein
VEQEDPKQKRACNARGFAALKAQLDAEIIKSVQKTGLAGVVITRTHGTKYVQVYCCCKKSLLEWDNNLRKVRMLLQAGCSRMPPVVCMQWCCCPQSAIRVPFACFQHPHCNLPLSFPSPSHVTPNLVQRLAPLFFPNASHVSRSPSPIQRPSHQRISFHPPLNHHCSSHVGWCRFVCSGCSAAAGMTPTCALK